MRYTTETIIRKGSPFKNSNNIGATYIERAIDEADGYIDSKIGEVYQLPLSETPKIIQSLSTRLAMSFLLEDQDLNIEIAGGVDMTGIMDDVESALEEIRTRKLKLYDSDGDEFAVKSRVKPSSYPTKSSTSEGDTEPMFTINQKF